MISSRINASLRPLIVLFGFFQVAHGADFHPISGISTTMVSGNEGTNPLTNVTQGAGVGFDAAEPHNQTGSTWYTDQAGADYINGRAGAEEIVFDMGSDVELSEISYWGYVADNANGMRGFHLKFATEDDGTSAFGTSITANPAFAAIQNPTPRQSFEFAPVTVRYVLLTVTSTFYGQIGAGPGGDRLGIGEIAFENRVVTLDPKLSVLPDIFLDVSRTVQTFDVAVTNLGGSDLTISGVTFGGTNSSAFSVVTVPGTIASFGSSTISIQFDPSALISGDFVPVSATMEITSNDPNSPTVVNLTAEVPAPPSEFYPISAVSSNVTNFYAVENLIRGIGVDFDADAPHKQLLGNATSTLWVTNGNGADFFNNVPLPAPALVFDLGEDRLLSEISVWGYSSGNSNGMSNFSLRFATNADGTDGFGTTVTYSPAYVVPFGFDARNSFDFDSSHTARYVELTPLDNYYGSGFAPGGDRVGIGEVAFEVAGGVNPEQNRFKILSIVRVAESMVDITFESISGRIYDIETSTDLKTWAPSGTSVIGTSGTDQTTVSTLSVASEPFFIHVLDTGQND